MKRKLSPEQVTQLKHLIDSYDEDKNNGQFVFNGIEYEHYRGICHSGDMSCTHPAEKSPEADILLPLGRGGFQTRFPVFYRKHFQSDTF